MRKSGTDGTSVLEGTTFIHWNLRKESGFSKLSEKVNLKSKIGLFESKVLIN